MKITERVVGQVIILSLEGKFLFGTRKEFQLALAETKKKNPSKIIFNMQACTYLDSAALGLLAIAFEQAKLQNIALCILSPSDLVRRTMELTQLPKIMPVHDTEDQAPRLTHSILAMAR